VHDRSFSVSEVDDRDLDPVAGDGPGVEADEGPTTAAADGGMRRVSCSGAIHHVREAESFLEDEEWCERAPFSRKLKRVYDEWRDGPPD
jgi:hypothetical protein